MFGRKKKAEEKERKSAEMEAVRLSALNPATKIYVMPEKFWLPEEPSKRFWTAGKVWTLVIVALALLIGAVYLLLSGTVNNQPTPAQPQNTQPATLPNEETNVDNVPLPVEEEAEEQPVEEEPIVEVEEDDTNQPAEAAPLPPLVAPKGIDQDGDGLTRAEELLYGTDDQLADSDGDTFIDTVELKNGYNPAGPGLTSETDVFSVYTNENGGYSVAYPSSWQPSSSGQNGVQFATGTGEIILILLQNNPNELPLQEWYERVAGVDASEIKNKTIGNIVGVQSQDERTFYFTLPSRPGVIFVVNHSIGSKSTVDFNTTVEVMISSLTVNE